MGRLTLMMRILRRLGFADRHEAELIIAPDPVVEPLPGEEPESAPDVHLWISPSGPMTLPPAHPLRDTVIAHPYYSQNLPRLVRHAQEKYPTLTVIDVGANVGDTAHFVRALSNAPVLCIEGSDEYVAYLERNTEPLPDITIEAAFLGDGSEDAFSVMATEGTGHLGAASVSQDAVAVRRLDEVIGHHPAFEMSKVLKSDTDGFELRVIRGAREFLSRARPVVFVEYDPFYLEEQGGTGAELRQELALLGYRDALVWDAYGYLMFGVPIDDQRVFAGLDGYFRHKKGLPYADIAFFHGEDEDLFQSFKAEEETFFRQNCSWVRPVPSE